MNVLLLIGAVFGFISVAAGAAVDHAADLSNAARASVDVALRYNMVYAVLVTGLSLAPVCGVRLAAWLFAAGTGLFCAGIYGSTLVAIPGIVYLTPVGGVILMAGWAALGVAALKNVRPIRPEDRST